MIRQLSKIFKLCLFWILFIETVSAQNIESKIQVDSLDRYGVFGIRPGMFVNLKKENRFASGNCGVFLDYNFGKFRHSIEIDFLARSVRKFFRNTYSPCFSYHFSVKKQLTENWELRPGLFFNCRMDFLNKKENYIFNDTAYLKTGQHTIFSLGPSLEISRKVFFSERNGFLILGFRLAYSFDIMGFGQTYQEPFMYDNSRNWIASADRFQRNALTFTFKIGWGKFIVSEKRMPENDFELGI